MLINASKPRPDRERARQIKEALRNALELDDDSTIMVTELACLEEGCPPIETVLALLRPGTATLQFKVHKPTKDIDTQDLAATCVAWGLEVRGPMELPQQ